MSAKKKLLITFSTVFAVVAIVAVSVLGTVAYMTAVANVTNTFAVGKVEISLMETLVDESGRIPAGTTTKTNKNDYRLLPGKTYDKDPTIYVSASTENCYLFILAKNQISGIEVQNDPSMPTMGAQMAANGWAVLRDTTAGSRVWIYCGNPSASQGSGSEIAFAWNTSISAKVVCGTAMAPATDGNGNAIGVVMTEVPLFENFYISGSADENENFNLYNGATVSLDAIAVQADGFTSETAPYGSYESVMAAWAAAVAKIPYIKDSVGSTEPSNP